MTRAEVLKIIDREAKLAGSQRALARRLGVSSSLLNDVILGTRSLSETILRPLGIEEVVSYRRIGK